MKLCLGVGPRPIHRQHLEVMKDVSEWTLVDLYCHDEGYKNWDARHLPLKDESVDVIYASHLLEHFSQQESDLALRHWYKLLKQGGKLILNVPDLLWALNRIQEYDDGKVLSGYYTEWEGEHGLLSILYGSQSHEGEYHKSGYTLYSLQSKLNTLGFSSLYAKTYEDAHDMGVIYCEATK